jgi:hypothetical protein
MKKWLIALLNLSLAMTLSAQQNGEVTAKEMSAVRIHEPIEIDGNLSEKVWKRPGSDSFTQRDPEEGALSTQRTEVWCAYDDEALYVAALLLDTAPDSIMQQMGRRDERLSCDWFNVFLDTYNDKRSGFYFGVNPAGCIQDGTLYNDSWEDDTWDGVWESATKINEEGWAVEMKIPYSQLRFKKAEENIWGINFSRHIQRRREYAYYVMIPREENGFVSRFATLKGLRNINPPRRIEVMPYVVGSYQDLIHDEADPFKNDHTFYKNVGADVKVGIGSNLTLDATINPDFGQVEVDPAVVNLSDFETYFSEKRPFFIEGSDIFRFGRGGATSYSGFNFGTPRFFYSRRIGRRPHGYPDHEGYVDMPDRTTILSAGKLSGKTGTGWSLGLLSAVTAREYARVDSEAVRFRDEVEPLTSYNVFRAQREFSEGRQGLGFIGTGLIRDLRNNNLSQSIVRQAYSAGVDGWTFLDKDKTWVLTGWAGATLLEGSSESILRIQQNSSHYYQRPDAPHLGVDSTATSLSGWGTRIYLNKERGNLQVNAALGLLSPGFDTNEMGYQYRSDVINAHVGIGYEWFKPRGIFRRKGIRLYTFRNFDFGGNLNGHGYFLTGRAVFTNYWGTHFYAIYSPSTLKHSFSRGGPLVRNPATWNFDIMFDTDSRKPVIFQAGAGITSDKAGYRTYSMNTGVVIKPSSRLQISLSPDYRQTKHIFQWVTRIEDPLADHTYGYRYIFAGMDHKTLSMSTRINWTFTPRLSFQMYLQPLISSGRYYDFKELKQPETHDFLIYGENGSTLQESDGTSTIDPDGPGPAEAFTLSDPNFNFKSLRGTAVLRWEYTPGSTLYLVWTQDRTDFQDPGNFSLKRDVHHLFSARSNNIFLVKLTYWLHP